jgi:uncharacterized protein YutE (UPF0331/DUF86 family)
VIAAQGLRKPLKLADIPQILAEEGRISRELGTKLSRASGLRNRLVHAYADIDHCLLFDVLQSGLTDIEDFARAIGALCGDSDTREA